MEEAIAAGQAELDSFNEDTAKAEQFVALAKKYTDFSELTTPMIYEFVDKVLVHNPERIDGERVQEVEIYLKYIGKVEIPAPELTPEEIEAEARAKKRRQQNRESYQRRKEREKKKLAVEQTEARDSA